MEYTKTPWTIKKTRSRRVIRGANGKLVGVIESGMSDTDAAYLQFALDRYYRLVKDMQENEGE
jgi:hypothetical protein